MCSVSGRQRYLTSTHSDTLTWTPTGTIDGGEFGTPRVSNPKHSVKYSHRRHVINRFQGSTTVSPGTLSDSPTSNLDYTGVASAWNMWGDPHNSIATSTWNESHFQWTHVVWWNHICTTGCRVSLPVRSWCCILNTRLWIVVRSRWLWLSFFMRGTELRCQV